MQERVNFCREIIISSLHEPTVDLKEITVNFLYNEDWKLYSIYEEGIIMSHEIKVIKEDTRTLLATVNMNVPNWNDIIIRDNASFIHENWTIRRHMDNYDVNYKEDDSI